MSKVSAAPRPTWDSMTCADCGMLVEPAAAFHPYLYCHLVKAGLTTDPAAFLARQGFIPDPAVWGEVTT